MYKYTKIQGPRFQRNYIIARYRKSDLHGTSFQSSPKINRMLITTLICIHWKITTPDHRNFANEDSVCFRQLRYCSRAPKKSTLSSDRIRRPTRFGKALNLIFPKHAWLRSRNDRFLLPVSTVSTRNTWPNDLPFVSQKKDQKFRGDTSRKIVVGVCCTLPETLTLFLWFFLPYFRSNQKFEKRTQFKTRVHKPYPISDQNGRIQTKTAKKTIKPFGAAHTYIAYIRDCPPGAKNALQIMNLAAYASETNNAFRLVESRDAHRLKGVFCSRRQLLFQILSKSSKKRRFLTARHTKLASTHEFDVIIVELQTSHEYCLQFADHLSPNYVM